MVCPNNYIDMNSKCSLPILLVSACDKASAEEFISELVDNDVSHTESERGGVEGRVWRLINKYYRADVLVQARGDSDPLPDDTARIEAHVAYFTSDECEGTSASLVECADRRAYGRAAVRVAALRAEHEDALCAWAARARYEPVALREAAGVVRVRDALHAHPWPGLQRLDRAAPRLALIDNDSDETSSDGEFEVGEEGEEDDVERAEQFALALGALGDAGVGVSALGDAERRERAEQLLAAFCRALGHRLDC